LLGNASSGAAPAACGYYDRCYPGHRPSARSPRFSASLGALKPGNSLCSNIFLQCSTCQIAIIG